MTLILQNRHVALWVRAVHRLQKTMGKDASLLSLLAVKKNDKLFHLCRLFLLSACTSYSTEMLKLITSPLKLWINFVFFNYILKTWVTEI